MRQADWVVLISTYSLYGNRLGMIAAINSAVLQYPDLSQWSDCSSSISLAFPNSEESKYQNWMAWSYFLMAKICYDSKRSVVCEQGEYSWSQAGKLYCDHASAFFASAGNDDLANRAQEISRSYFPAQS